MSDRSSQTSPVTMPPGDYIVGDPCYSIASEKWIGWLTAANYESNDDVLDAAVPETTLRAVGVSTVYGDGAYRDQHGREYGVDSGLIGVVPFDAVGDKTWEHGAHRVTFAAEFTIERDDEGNIIVGDIVIPTGDSDEDDDDDYWGDADEEYENEDDL